LDIEVQISDFLGGAAMISQTAEYALRAVVLLGASPGRPLTTQQIAEESGVPAGYLSKVLQGLGRAGLVEAQRGLRGGFVLASPLDELTVLEVINAVDPLRRIERCPLGRAEHGWRLCPLHRRLDEGVALLEELYGETTIAELVARPDPIRPMCGGGRPDRAFQPSGGRSR
jgi:Rrf2 family protein